MAKSVISEGRTTQEAIEKGLKEIKLPKEYTTGTLRPSAAVIAAIGCIT